MNEVALIRRKRWDGAWEYSLYCVRCTSTVHGERTSMWASSH